MNLPRLGDCIRPGVRVLFVGINPGVRSALTGHHFAGHSNRFWKLLYASGLVPERTTHEDDERLPSWSFGLTNIVPRATPGIDALTRAEYAAGRRRVRAKVRRYRPRVVALVGVTVYRALFPQDKGRITCGARPDTLAGATVFVLPNPSGRNASYSYAEMLASYRALARFLGRASDARQKRRRGSDGPRSVQRSSMLVSAERGVLRNK